MAKPRRVAKPVRARKKQIDPTQHAYSALHKAYNYLNKRFFGGRLPGVMLTMQRRRGANGYFAFERFQGGDDRLWDEIAMNSMHFRTRSPDMVLSTLAHEMVHQRQHHEGKPSRRNYHNKQWGDWMEAMGLMPSTTGQPGGRRTGQRVTHYIIPGGPFARAVAELPFDPDALYQDIAGEREGKPRKQKIKHECPDCGLAVWSNKPTARVACIDCEREMIVDGPCGGSLDRTLQMNASM